MHPDKMHHLARFDFFFFFFLEAFLIIFVHSVPSFSFNVIEPFAVGARPIVHAAGLVPVGCQAVNAPFLEVGFDVLSHVVPAN